MSLLELALATAVGSITLVIVAVLVLYGLRSFALMGNCTSMDDRNRITADRLSRELREATRVLSYSEINGEKRLVVTNSVEGFSISYDWHPEQRILTSRRSGQDPIVSLHDCEAWEVTFYQVTAQAGAEAPFLLATNSAGWPDPERAKLIKLSWRCARPVAGTTLSTECSQSVEVALRNSTP